MGMPSSGRSHRQSQLSGVRDRRRGNAVVGVLILLLLLCLALAGNYVRNYQTDQQQEERARPYSKYALGDLELLAEGYRTEIAKLEARHGGGRVETRSRHHFGDQVREFERVQKAARRSRDSAVDIAQTRADLKEVEDEIATRKTAGSDLEVHIERLFRF